LKNGGLDRGTLVESATGSILPPVFASPDNLTSGI
jgi:hypothetical protein